VSDTVRGADREDFVTPAARRGRAIRFLNRALPGCIDAHLSKSRSGCIRPGLRIRTASLTQRRWIEKPAGTWSRAHSFYDRLHGNIA
jgi:hypothetical protein